MNYFDDPDQIISVDYTAEDGATVIGKKPTLRERRRIKRINKFASKYEDRPDIVDAIYAEYDNNPNADFDFSTPKYDKNRKYWPDAYNRGVVSNYMYQTQSLYNKQNNSQPYVNKFTYRNPAWAAWERQTEDELKNLWDDGFTEASDYLYRTLQNYGPEAYKFAYATITDNIEKGFKTDRQASYDMEKAVREGMNEAAPYIGAAVYGPMVAGAVGSVAGQVASDVIGVGAPFWKGVAKETLAGMLGSETANLGSELITGQTLDQHISNYLQKYGVPQKYADTIGPFFNPGGWLSWGAYNNFRKTFTPSKPSSNSLKVESPTVTPNSAPEVSTVMADPVQEAPFPEIIYKHTTYPRFFRNMFKNKAGVQLQNRRFQVYGDYQWIDHGIYNDPEWTEFYETILKPLNSHSELPAKKPRLGNFSNQSPSVGGIFIPDYKVSVIDIYGSPTTGVHEYISHGTDDFADPGMWEHTFATFDNPLTPRHFTNSSNWWEQRATVNEARFQIYLRLKDRLGRKPTTQEYQNYLDSLTDDEIINNVLFEHPEKQIHRNGYAQDYHENFKDGKIDSFALSNRLRERMKYVFGLPILPILPSLYNITTEENEK